MTENIQNELEENINTQLMENYNTEMLNPKKNNIDIYLMEKDKEIMNLCVLNKSLISQIEELKRENKEKEIQISSLKTDLNSLEVDKNILIKENEKLDEKINGMNNILISKDNKINEITKKSEQNINEINNAYNTQIRNYEDTLKNMQTIKIDNNTLIEKLVLKDKEIINMQKMIFDLKQENKKIFTLEKEINERNLNIFNLKECIKKLEKQIFIYENSNDVLFNINKYNLNYSNANIPKNNNNYKINRDINVNNNNTKINTNEKGVLNSYYNYLNSNLISFIIEQIKRVEMSIDNKNISFKNNILPTKLSEENSTNDLIRQNFELLINKINNLHQDNFNNKTELKNELEEEKNKNIILTVNIKKSKNEIDNMKKILENKTAEIDQLNNKLNQMYSSQNNNTNRNNNNNENDTDISNNFEQQYNGIFSKLKNFSYFYCKDTNNNASSGLKTTNLKLPNYSLDDNILKKINDIFFTLKNLINFVEQNLKKNNLNNLDIKGNFEKYMNEINSLNLKIKKLSELFKKNENLLKQITDENKELKLRNEELENILNSINKPNNSNASKTNNLNNVGNINNNFNTNNSNSNNYCPPFSSEMQENKSNIELKDIMNLNKIKNDNLINEFYNKNMQMNTLEDEANKLIRENYAGNNKNIVNKINNSNNINNNNRNNNNKNNPIYTFKNENDEQNRENFEDEEIPENYNIYNNNINNDDMNYNEEDIYIDNNNEENNAPQYNNDNDNDNEQENEINDNDNDDYNDYDNNNYNDYDNNYQNEEGNYQSE